MAKNTKVEVDGAITDTGNLKGKGAITFRFPDTGAAKLSLDYSRPDRLILDLEAEAGLKISRNRTLTLSGQVGRDFLRGTYDGGVSVRFEIPSRAKVSVSHRFDEKGRLTSIKFSGKF